MPLSDSRPDQHQACCCGSLPPHLGRVSHVAYGTFPTCHPHYPGGPDQVHLSVASLSASAFLEYRAGRRPLLYFRGLLKVHSRYGLPVCSQPKSCTSVSRASGGRSPYPPVWIATGLNRQLPGRNSHPLAPYTLVAHPHLVVQIRNQNCDIYQRLCG